jgi:hypothetical protein
MFLEEKTNSSRHCQAIDGDANSGLKPEFFAQQKD